MSRIGKKPILIPAGVEVKIDQDFIIVKGAKSELKLKTHPHVNVLLNDKEINITVKEPDIKSDKALWGLYGSLIKNMILGVTTGFQKKLEINGVGYKVQANGDKLTLNLGFSHPVDFIIPKDISAIVEKNTISISGPDKQLVGQIAASLRALKPPEPYKGKGIKYSDETIKRKAGKAAKAAGAK
ncbi:50S ribosomal protein L6 [Candidatus Falkowbacteria bacterium RIFOXYB2_FULL_38_15]|uniref:Large ribosomal subunit protein uL6 n=1 Tax=Candidatus Falkowbacteria bacterium RIFOXYA2_FULL_38_12 TaxID=1797993 RepID=A0A1F5S2V6_9BACT|nr:MAG: 50S ribosomal protein L6 [Candidatus Falkowbacteria bacterium RIFOXYA2_FULL_38_12]OGF33142.1 MAG: 50S ribosomal protein L6 [Candidatus Falkowbacteria bacterium RIFOXYB2_FULL_38_15]OGF43833.1 MAG: 50S ribosomal protein L6 [Candidatus Falkowbacteria bacterium RIFOXYD2_FULL_39_16]